MNTDSDHALAMLLAHQYDDFDIDPPSDEEPRKRKKQPKKVEREQMVKEKAEKEGMNTGKFTDDELLRFKQGLELYGRDWAKLTAHVQTRDSNAIRSHAQKYFIKLFREGKELPSKVVESGSGYTLSGKPLDPESAAAKPYLRGWTLKPVEQGVVLSTDNSTITKPQPKKEKKVKVKKEKDVFHSTARQVEAPTQSRFLRQRKAYDPIAVAMKGYFYLTRQEYTMIPCESYKGEPGSGNLSQPFKIKVHKSALLVMDLHAHLMRTEVIGFLAGRWDPTEKMLWVVEALPCKSVEQEWIGGDRHINVELDPASEVQTREIVESRGLQIVGWYHSHPTFAPDPSLIDLYNQRNYQNLFRVGDSEEPFVGAICAPYDSRCEMISNFNWFYVGNGQRDKNRPKRLDYKVEELVVEMEKIKLLIHECGERNDRVDLEQGWRKDRWETKLEKLKSSLRYWFENEQTFGEFWVMIDKELGQWQTFASLEE